MIQEKIRPFLESISDQKESENLAVMYYECSKDDDEGFQPTCEDDEDDQDEDREYRRN